MQGTRIFITVTALCLLAQGVMPATAQADEPSGACALFTQADASQLLQTTVSAGASKTTITPAGESCRYRFNQNGATYGIKVRISSDAALKEEGIYDSVADLMERQKRARQSNSYAAKKYRELSGLGDEAFWNGDDLWMRKGERLVIITVNSFLAGSFKDRQSLDRAQEEQNLSLSQQAAQTLLSRL